MSREELLRALRGLSVETGSLACLGCGYEHNCSLHGCAVIREAVKALEELPNNPLTLEELRGMDGEPVWIAREDGEDCWALIRYCNFCGIGTYGCGFLVFDTYSINWLAYRRKPEEIPYEGLD